MELDAVALCLRGVGGAHGSTTGTLWYLASSKINGAWHMEKAHAMTLHTSRGQTSTGCALVVLGLLCVGPLGSSAMATTPIYKCFDRKFDVVYTDVPCKDGAPLDVRAGEADPVAVARLERARDALDQSAAQRIQDMRWTSAQAAFTRPWYAGPSEQVEPDYSPYGYGPMWGLDGFGITGFHNARHPRARPRAAFNSPSFAHMRPTMGGRR